MASGASIDIFVTDLTQAYSDPLDIRITPRLEDKQRNAPSKGKPPSAPIPAASAIAFTSSFLEFESKIKRPFDYSASRLSHQDDELQKAPSSPKLQEDLLPQCSDIFVRSIPILYGVFTVGILALYVAGFADEALKTDLIWYIASTSLLCCLVGAWSVYRYGVIHDHIERMKAENVRYEKQLEILGRERQQFEDEMTVLRNTVSDLKYNAKAMEEETKEFEGLIEDLRSIEGTNEDVLDLAQRTNRIFSDMRAVVLESERAHLLSTYYGCALMGADKRMYRRQYISFLNRLTNKQRVYFEAQGSFDELQEDGHIHLETFLDILENVLKNVDELLREEFELADQC